jgi:hypothetical protein
MEDTMDYYALNDPTFLAMCYKAISYSLSDPIWQ